MTAQDLKNAILQLAVQGKLVPQNTTEGEADVRGIKQKPTEELGFDIPQTWKTAHIECISNIVPSKQFQILESEVCKTGGFPVISQSKEYTIGFTDVTDRVFHHDAPVIAFGDHTTEVKYITFDFVVGADGVKIFEPNTEIVFPQFLYYTLLYYTIGLNKVGGYSRHYKFIKNKPIPIPPLSEQQRIVAKIEELMPLVEEYGEAEERLTTLNAEFPDKLRKSILQQAIQGKLTERDPADEPASELLKRIHAEKERLIKEGKIKKETPLPPITEEEVPFDIPDGWVWVRLQQIVFSREQETPTERFSYIDIGSIDNQCQCLNTKETLIDPENAPSRARKLVELGDILYSTVRPYLHNMCIIDREFSYKPIASTGFAVLACCAGVYNKFLFYYLLSPAFDNYVNDTAKGAAYPAINDNQLFRALIPLPPFAEQQRIVDRVNELIATCYELK